MNEDHGQVINIYICIRWQSWTSGGDKSDYISGDKSGHQRFFGILSTHWRKGKIGNSHGDMNGEISGKICGFPSKIGIFHVMIQCSDLTSRHGDIVNDAESLFPKKAQIQLQLETDSSSNPWWKNDELRCQIIQQVKEEKNPSLQNPKHFWHCLFFDSLDCQKVIRDVTMGCCHASTVSTASEVQARRFRPTWQGWCLPKKILAFWQWNNYRLYEYIYNIHYTCI